MVTSSASALQPGASVQVDWGLEEVTASVVEVYGTGLGVRVVVEVPVLGPAGEHLDSMHVTVPAQAVH